MVGSAARRAFAMALVVALTILLRLPALLHQHAIDDESTYAVVANEIVHGGQPYVDAVERKPPLLFWTYAAVFDIAGIYNWRALHLVALFWTLGTMAGLYVLARSMFDRRAGLIAALAYSLFQIWGTWKNVAFNGELLMNLPIVWAWVVVCRRTSSSRRPDLFVAGLLFGAAFLLKQPAAVALLGAMVYVLLPSYRTSRRLTLGHVWAQEAGLAGGFLAIIAVVAALLEKESILREAFYWTIADHTVPVVLWSRGLVHTAAFIVATLPLIVGAARSLVDVRIWRGLRAERSGMIALLITSCVGVAASGRFYPHYYIQVLPPLAVLAAGYYSVVWRAAPSPRRTLGWYAVGAFLFVAPPAFLGLEWIGLAAQGPTTGAGRYIAAHAALDDRIFVWGQSPEIYLDAHRRPASRYIATFPLTGYIFGTASRDRDTSDRIVPGAWDNLERDFARHPPAYIVDVTDNPDVVYPVERFCVLARLLSEQFEPVASTAEGVVYRRRAAASFVDAAPASGASAAP